MKKIKSVRVDRFAVLFYPTGILVVLRTVSARESSSHIYFCIIECSESEQMPSISQNDGMASPDNFSRQKGLNGVTFAIYDVSDEFCQAAVRRKSIEDAQRKTSTEK